MNGRTEIKKTSTLTGSRLSRRDLMGAAAAAAAFTFVPKRVLGEADAHSANNKLNIAAIGVGGRGASDIRRMTDENIVALCDVDLDRASETIKQHPRTKIYRDFRRMLDREANHIDAVVIGAPDHIHAPAAVMAMRLGKHVYVEKPMAHTIWEARTMTEVAKEMGVVTQMGNQGHAGEGIRLTHEWIHDGAIGTVREVHVWSDRAGTPDRAWWPQGVNRPQGTQPIPRTLDWDLWLGPAPWRPYHSDYVPFKWRGRYDFGCGAIGDMAVHNADPAFFCLDLDAPVAVEAETSEVTDDTFPKWNIITYEFAAKGNRPPVTMKWYDGAKLPPRPPEMEEGRRLGTNGILFVGDKGKILCGGHADVPSLIPYAMQKAYDRPAKTLPRIKGGIHQNFIDACKANDPEMACANFSYSGPFVESLLVGNLAVRLKRRIEWDAKAMRSPNAPEADNLITKFYRTGWEIG